jgi:hypothetical protein
MNNEPIDPRHAAAGEDIIRAANAVVADYEDDDEGRVTQYAIARLAQALGAERPKGVSPAEWGRALTGGH